MPLDDEEYLVPHKKTGLGTVEANLTAPGLNSVLMYKSAWRHCQFPAEIGKTVS